MPEPATNRNDTLVHSPRQAAEELTGCRLQITTSQDTTVHIPLPREAPPSLSHLAVGIDMAAGQAATHQLTTIDTALRTVSLNAQLTGPLTSGKWFRAVSRTRAHKDHSIVCTCEVFDSTNNLVALGSCRFIVVNAVSGKNPTTPPETLDYTAIPPSWDSHLGLGKSSTRDTNGNPEGIILRPAAPTAATANHTSIVHGGIQVRALELAMRSALKRPGNALPSVLSDISVTFHRPVPTGKGTEVTAQSAVLRRGTRLSVAKASFTGPNETLMNTAEGIFIRG